MSGGSSSKGNPAQKETSTFPLNGSLPSKVDSLSPDISIVAKSIGNPFTQISSMEQIGDAQRYMWSVGFAKCMVCL